MKVDIYFLQLLKEDGSGIGGGGIGTQLAFLCPLLDKLGYETTMYQCYHKPFETKFGKTTVVGIHDYPGKDRPTKEVVNHFRSIAAQRARLSERIEIFAADFFSVRNKNPLAISIMQGLSWDVPVEVLTENRILRTRVGENILRLRKQIRGVRFFENCYNRVVADLTFLNWYRSFRGPDYGGRVWYNPNPAVKVGWNKAREKKAERKKPVRIVFARRLVQEKGTRLAVEVFRELLALYPNVEITVAGEGLERPFMEQSFANEKRVTFTSYEAGNATEFHKKFDIALVPSVCGEATSFSILEAMSAGCAVVATNMFGIITEIIPMHNGILCFPNRDSIVEGVKFLIENPEKRREIQKNAWSSVQTSFSLQQWKQQWTTILAEVVNGKEEAQERLRKRPKRFYYFF